MMSKVQHDTKLDILKFVDHWVGIQICGLLSLLERVTHPSERLNLQAVLSDPPKLIVINKFFGLGSVLLSSNLVRSIKKEYPKARIIFLTFKENAKLLELLAIVDEIKVIDTSSPLKLIGSVFSALIYFSFNKPDVTIDLEFFSKFSTMMAYLSGARWRVGFYLNEFWRYPLINVPVYFNYTKHIIDIYSLCAKAIGIDLVPALPDPIQVSQEAKQGVEDFWAKQNISKEDIILSVNVNASDLAYCRRWPLEKFAGVINTLLNNRKEMKVILTGSSNEKEYVSRIFPFLDAGISERVIDSSGMLTLEQFIAALGKFDAFLTNDSGPFHLAQVQKTPMVSIWGAGLPELYGHYGKPASWQRVVYKRWPCSPCLYIYRTSAGFFCDQQAPCLEGINITEVISAIEEVIHVKKCGKEG